MRELAFLIFPPECVRVGELVAAWVRVSPQIERKSSPLGIDLVVCGEPGHRFCCAWMISGETFEKGVDDVPLPNID